MKKRDYLSNINETNEKPDCYGDLDGVFPMGEDGLRQSPDKCMFECGLKTDCLREAIATQRGIELQEKQVKKNYESGMMNFFQRWSAKKRLENKKQK